MRYWISGTRKSRVGLVGIAAMIWTVNGALAQKVWTDWTIPRDAATARAPVAVSGPVVKHGGTLYRRHCQRCHGPGGRGDGTEADPNAWPGDLTDPARTDANPDGVLFYKIWNGRLKPAMPAYNEKLTKEEAWAVVHYIKTLRRVPAPKPTRTRDP
jgi:mono/diheme cytochrome c family protein